MYTSLRRPASKEGYSDTFRCKCSIREKSCSFKVWDLEKQTQLSVADIKQVTWPESRMAIVAQLSGVYFQAGGCGAVMNIKSIGLTTCSAECPFEFLDSP